MPQAFPREREGAPTRLAVRRDARNGRSRRDLRGLHRNVPASQRCSDQKVKIVERFATRQWRRGSAALKKEYWKDVH